jgi:hypothetical protein
MELPIYISLVKGGAWPGVQAGLECNFIFDKRLLRATIVDSPGNPYIVG